MIHRWRIGAHPARPLSVQCPVCKAQVGRRCPRYGGDRTLPSHRERYTAANDTYLKEAAVRRRLDFAADYGEYRR